MDTRSFGLGNRAQSVRREKLDSEGGKLAGGSSHRRGGTSTIEKRKRKQNKTETMNKETQAISNDMRQLAEDAQALMSATADVAGEKVGEARKRLAAALERGKEVYGRVREKAVEVAKAADEAVHERPYQAIGIALGVGAILGYLAARRCSRSSD